MTKTLDTLIHDIHKLFEDGHECSEENIKAFGEEVGRLMYDRLKAYKTEREGTLRMSNLGKPVCQLWFDINEGAGEELPASAKIKFLYGDLLEAMLLLLAKEAGHTVEDEQKEVELEGVLGHIDAKIDGTVVDVKSTSDFAFRKFRDGTLAENDSFGYIEQISGYSEAENLPGAFLAINKVTGDLALLKVPDKLIKEKQMSERIKEVRTIINNKKPPARCFDSEPFQASGNKKLGTVCSYCSQKHRCWSDANNGAGLRTFLYSNGPVFLTEVKKEPNVFEVPND